MPGTVQNGTEQLVVATQIVEGLLAHVRAEVPDAILDVLEGKIEGKLPHPFDQCLGSCR
jgi:proteasome lid subunit RPN8/RPN11